MTVLRVIGAFAAKDLRLAVTYRLSFVMGVLGTFWSLASFRFISKLVGIEEFRGSETEYFDFVVVGIALTGVLSTAVTAAATTARTEQTLGTLEVWAAEPVSPAVLSFGWSSYPTMQALVMGIITMATAVPLGFDLPDANWPLALLTLVVCGVAFAPLGFIGAAVVLAFQQGGGLTTMLTAAMTLVSGALFPVELLPGWLQAVSALSPMTYALEALRGAMLDGAGLADVRDELGVLVLFMAILTPACVGLVKLAFSYARRMGSLARY